MFRIRSRRGPVFYQNLWGFAFAVPALILLLIFSIYPLLNALYFSTTSWGLGDKPTFIGLDNYIKLATVDVVFWQSLKTTTLYAIGLNPLLWALSLALALIFNRSFKFRGIFRTIFFTPVIVSWVVAAIVWSTILQPSFGLNAQVMRIFGQPGFSLFDNSSTALPTIILMVLWKDVGYFMVLFLAGLQNIPGVYYEAAAIDGASQWQQFRHITFPLLKPTTLFVVIISIIQSFQAFTPIWLTTAGGPAGATRVLPILIYQNAFRFYGKIGYASAMAFFLFVVLMIITLIQMRLFRVDPDN